MQKSDLINLLEANDRKYPVFLKKAKECTVTEKWGSGVGAPFFLVKNKSDFDQRRCDGITPNDYSETYWRN